MTDDFDAAAPLMSEPLDVQQSLVADPALDEQDETETYAAAPPIIACVAAREAIDDQQCTTMDGKLWVQIVEKRYRASQAGYRKDNFSDFRCQRFSLISSSLRRQKALFLMSAARGWPKFTINGLPNCDVIRL